MKSSFQDLWLFSKFHMLKNQHRALSAAEVT